MISSSEVRVEVDGSVKRNVHLEQESFYSSAPQPLWHQGLASWKTIFPQTRVGQGGNCFWMIQALYIYCALYFYYYYIVIYNEIIIQLMIMQNQWEP